MRQYIKYLLLIVSLFVIFSMSKTTFDLLGKGNMLEEARLAVDKLRKERQELLLLREKVESDEFVEKEARERLGLAREGETIVVLPEEEVLRKLAPELDEEEYIEEKEIYERWIELFF